MSKLLYKPGDKVTICSDLKCGTSYPVLYGPGADKKTLYCNLDMAKLRGKTFEIDRYIFDRQFYGLKGVEWAWTESMFEDLKECFCESLL